MTSTDKREEAIKLKLRELDLFTWKNHLHFKKKCKLKNRRDLVNEVKSRAEKQRMKLILTISQERGWGGDKKKMSDDGIALECISTIHLKDHQ